MSQEKLERDEETLRLWREAYYNLSPLVSDQEYDTLRDKVAKYKPNSPEVVAVGAAPPQHSVWEKVRHEIPMGSLNKANDIGEFREWAEKTGARTFHITHKIDGSSIELVYDGGKLVRCVTRGDGIIGEDVTVNVSRVPNIPKTIMVQEHLMIRGEIVMMKDMFQEKYSKEYANPRNTAAAKVREKKGGGADCENLSFIAYWVSDHPNRGYTFLGIMTLLKSLGFDIPKTHHSMGTLESTILAFEQARQDRDKVPYEVDGMVVSVANLKDLEELGDMNMRPRGQIAWKFDAAMGETRVIDVKWQVGLTGRITPVTIVEPVNIGGVVITNVSLHNLDMFHQLKLWPGCRVLVARRGDVIPYIERNLDIKENL